MKKNIFFIGTICLLPVIFIAWFAPSAFIGAPADFTVPINIPKDADAAAVSGLLRQKSVITSALGYRIYSMIDSSANKPREGSYEVAPGASYKSLARQFVIGPTRNEISTQFIEGSNLKDWRAALTERNVSATSVTDLVGDLASGKSFASALRDQFDFLKNLPADATLEGYLFPNTYRVWQDQLPLGLVLKQLNEFAKQTEGFAAEARIGGRSLHEIVILASIVEKEGRNPEERRMIAGIYLNRLEGGMRLQSDATVNYITGANRPRPTLDDLESDSPYNTYRNAGLPPGPICNPGKDSLDASLNPTASGYYYYLHDDEGKVYYAETIEQHKQNRFKAYGE